LVGLGPHSSNVGPDAAPSGEGKRPADQADTDDRDFQAERACV